MFLLNLFLLFLPSKLKIFILKWLGWTIGFNSYIGFSFIQSRCVTIGNNVYIGHFNVIWRLRNLVMENGSRVNYRNWITGANKGTFSIGRNSAVSGRHFVDASAGFSIGHNSILAGRESQFFSHGISPDCLDDKRPIQIGDWCYIGSACRFVPGAKVSNHCFVGMGSVVTKVHDEEYVLLAGVPAKVRKKLKKTDAFFNRSYFPHAHHLPDYDGNIVTGALKK